MLTLQVPQLSAMRTLLVLVSLLRIAESHSWVEQILAVAPNGTFAGFPGYIRGFVPRNVPGFNDSLDLNLLPPDRRANQSYISPTDPMCNPLQTTLVQTSGYPRIQAAPGSTIALQYQENGHVTLPTNQPGKPANRGTVYIYGTSQPLTNEYLLTVHRKWTTDGTGGDKRGRLLSTQNFDDGQCYQINNGNISEARQKEFPFTPSPGNPMGANLWCQNDVVLPSDMPTSGLYTLYWVWDWPTLPGVDPDIPDGKEEIYTSCMDVQGEVQNSSPPQHAVVGYAKDQAVDNAAVSSYVASIAGGSNILVTTPANDNVAQPTPTMAAASSTITNSIATTQPASTEVNAIPLMTVYPISTVMTTVLFPLATETASTVSAMTAVSTPAAESNPQVMVTTITITPTVYVTVSVPTSSPPGGTTPPSIDPPAPASPSAAAPYASYSAAATESLVAAAASSTQTTPSASSNCTSGTIQKRSRVLGGADLEERAVQRNPVPFKPERRPRLPRSARFRIS